MTCQHEKCDCDIPLADNERFCGIHCEDAVTYGRIEEHCRCGHPGCADAEKSDEEPTHVTPPS